MKEHASRASVSTNAASSQAAAEKPSVSLRQSGNLAVQRLLRGGAIQARRDGAGTPDEAEAERVARQVVHSHGSAGHGGCSCGKTSCPKCAAKQAAAGRVQAKEKPSADSQLDLDNAAAAVASLTGGLPLEAAQRSFFESKFSADFSGVRIHTGPAAEAAADRLNARAFTVGADIVFGRGEYRPESTEGQMLLAHELTHVMQQSAAPSVSSRVQRDPKDDYSDETYPQFVQRVRNRAIARLDRNIEALGEWSGYIAGMTDFQLGSQMTASNIRDYAATATEMPRGGEVFETFSSSSHGAERDYAEARLDVTASGRDRNLAFLGMVAERSRGYFTSPSTADQMQQMVGDRTELPASVWVSPDFRYHNYKGIFEAFVSGEHGGCQTCHDFNAAWQQTIKEFGDPLPTGPAFPTWVDTRGPLMFGSGFSRTPDFTQISTTDDQAIREFIGTLSVPTNTATAATTLTGTTAAPISASSTNPFLPDIPIPANVEAPIPRSGLCGAAPPQQAVDPMEMAPSWGPGSAIVANAVRRIGGVLTPLGPRGYQVLPRQTFDQLRNATPEQLEGIRSSIQENIRTRQDNYRELQSQIRSGAVPFNELCPIIDELLPTTNENLRSIVEIDIKIDQAMESVIDTLLKIVGAAMLVFAIVFPPSIMLSGPMLAAGAGLSLIGIATGARDYRRGSQYELGIGSGIYSREQEAMAESLRFWGAFSMLANAISLGATLRTAGALSKAASATGTLPADARIAGVLPGTRAQMLEDGRTLIYHPDHPHMIGILDRQGLTMIENGQIIGHFPVPAGATGVGVAGSEGAGTASLMRSLPAPQSGPMSLLPASAGSRAMTPLPVGGISMTPGPLSPTAWNPLGNNMNCGYCTISGLMGRALPGIQVNNADEMYIATLQSLQLPTTGPDPISRQLIFPSADLDKTFANTPGYAVLFEPTRLPSMYSFPQVASGRGLQTIEAQETLRNWRIAYGPGTQQQAAQNYLEMQEELGREITLQQANATISRLRSSLTGDYAIGSIGKGHYMAMEITPTGQIIGMDFQDGRTYMGLEAILNRMNRQLDMIRRVTGAAAQP